MTTFPVRRLIAVAVALAAVGGATAGSAMARPEHARTSAVAASTFAGYAGTAGILGGLQGPLSSVDTTLRVPKVNCDGASAETFGLHVEDGLGNQGTGGVLASCSATGPASDELVASVQGSTHPATAPVASGDLVEVSFLSNASTVSIAVTNETSGGGEAALSSAVDHPGGRQRFEIGAFDDGRVIPQFSTAFFTGSQVDAAHLRETSPTAVSAIASDSGRASAAGLRAKPGAFTVTYHR